MLKILDRFSILLFTALLCIVYLAKTWQLDWLVIRYPYVVIAILTGLLLSIGYSESKKWRKQPAEQKQPNAVSTAQFATLSLAMFFYITCIEFLGYFTASTLFVCLLMYKLGNKNYKQIIVGTTIFVGLQYLFFRVLLNLPIPAGLFV